MVLPFSASKKPSSLKIFSGTRAIASCYHPKFTYTSRYKPYQLRMRNDSSIVYHCNGCTRRSLSIIASVRSSETIISSSFCVCSHLIRLSVTYLTTYSSLHSLWYYFVNHTANSSFCQYFVLPYSATNKVHPCWINCSIFLSISSTVTPSFAARQGLQRKLTLPLLINFLWAPISL